MKIAFNALCAGNQSGTGRYASELLKALGAVDRENQYAVCLDRRSPLRVALAKFRNFQTCAFSVGGPLRRQLFERFRLRRWIARTAARRWGWRRAIRRSRRFGCVL